MTKDLLASRIKESPITLPEQEFLLKRLSIASHAGMAHIVCDLEQGVMEARKRLLPSYRRFAEGKSPVSMNKTVVFTHFA